MSELLTAHGRMMARRACPLPSVLFVGLLILTAWMPLSAWDRTNLIGQSDSIGNDWYYLPTFGYFLVIGNAALPEGHIWHNEHGWLWVFASPNPGQTDEHWWLLDTDMEHMIWRLKPGDYPSSILRQDNGNCCDQMSYDIGTAPQRVFTVSEYADGRSPGQEIREVQQEYMEHGPHGPVPIWWKMFGAVDLTVRAEHQAPATVGQLKHVATIAKSYIDGELGLSTSDWNNAYSQFGASNPFPFTPAGDGSDYGVLNTGQLKFASAGFYHVLDVHRPEYDVTARLLELGLDSQDIHAQAPYLPWPEGGTPDHQTAANLGQLKLVFSFDLDNGLFAPPDPPPPPASAHPSVSEEDLGHLDIEPMGIAAGYTPNQNNWGTFFELTDDTQHLLVQGYYWVHSHWYGWFAYDENTFDLSGSDGAWVWHAEHGWTWLYERNSGPGQYMFDLNLGVMWVNRSWSTNQGKIGWLFSYGYDTYLFYYGRGHEGRRFLHFADGVDIWVLDVWLGGSLPGWWAQMQPDAHPLRDGFSAQVRSFAQLPDARHQSASDAQSWSENQAVSDLMQSASGLAFIVLPDQGPYVVTTSNPTVNGISYTGILNLNE